MTVQRLFSIIMMTIGAVALAGSLKLPLTSRVGVGPGTMPLIFSIMLVLLSAAFFFTDEKDAPRIDWRALLMRPTVDGVVFYLLNFALFVLLYLIGTAPAMVIFGIATQLTLKRQKPSSAVIFSLVWVALLYIIFDRLLYVPFERGVLFG